VATAGAGLSGLACPAVALAKAEGNAGVRWKGQRRIIDVDYAIGIPA